MMSQGAFEPLASLAARRFRRGRGRGRGVPAGLFGSARDLVPCSSQSHVLQP